MTTREAYLKIRDLLQEAGIEDAGFEAEQLLRHVCGASRFDDRPIEARQYSRLKALAKKRAGRFPLQYILGRWPFLEVELELGPMQTLIPRPETEEVCLAAIEAAERRGAAGGSLNILDLCSGSGAIALALQHRLPAARETAVEWEAGAMHYLERNIAAFGRSHPGAQGALPVAVRADALLYWRRLAENSLDLIVCNPPYVTEAEYAALAPELRHEPKPALVPRIRRAELLGLPPELRGELAPKGALPDDGLLFYRVISRCYFAALRPGGALVYEIGAGQGPAVREILEKNGYAGVEIRPDMAGRDRIALGRRP